jgi:hypothetical protein
MERASEAFGLLRVVGLSRGHRFNRHPNSGSFVRSGERRVQPKFCLKSLFYNRGPQGVMTILGIGSRRELKEGKVDKRRRYQRTCFVSNIGKADLRMTLKDIRTVDNLHETQTL